MFKLPPEVEEELRKARELELGYKQTMSTLSDKNLASAAKFWMAHCVSPGKVKPDEPVYDATMWHVILPEMIKRLEER